MFDDAFHFGVFVAGLSAGIHIPAETDLVAGGPDHESGFFKESVIRDQAEGTGFDIGGAVERIHEEPERAFIEGDGHRIYGKVAAAQGHPGSCLVVNAFAGLWVFDAVSANQIDADRTRKTKEKAVEIRVFPQIVAPAFSNGFLSLRALP